MEKEHEEMQFLGFFGIYKESYKITVSRRKIFTQITLSLILPLSFLFLLRTKLSNALTGKILQNTVERAGTPPGSPQYQSLSHEISSEWSAFILFNLVHFIFALAFSLLSTSAVVYTVATVYAAAEEQLTFRKVMSVVPKVWKRLAVTSLCTALAFFVYYVVAALVMAVLAAITFLIDSSGKAHMFVIAALAVLFFVGLLCLAVVWELATVVSVLEECYGFRALRKSKELIKGKTGLAVMVFLTQCVFAGLLQFLFNKVVVLGVGGGGGGWGLSTVVYGVVHLFLFSVLVLIGIVLRTVIYFVCKSYHHESIDKSALWGHLQVYVGPGEYEPLTAKDVSLEKYQV